MLVSIFNFSLQLYVLAILVNITPKAITRIKEIRKKKNIPEEYGLRIGIKGMGCAGTSYLLGFDKQKEKDDTYIVENIRVLIEKRHAIHLAGIKLDYYDGNGQAGFMFVNETD